MARREFRTSNLVTRVPLLAAIVAAAFLAMLTAAGSPAAAEEATDTQGADLYRQHCASCHGSTGWGDGPIADKLKIPPPALTTLSRRNAGTFPTDYVYRIIDGREARSAHGGRDMPVWGTYYGLQARWRDRGGPDTETIIRQRIVALIDHLKSVQVSYTAGAAAADGAAAGPFLERHLAAFGARDIEAVMQGYTDDSVLVIPTGVLEGRAQIRDYYRALFAEFGSPGAEFNVVERKVVANVARIAWSGRTADAVYEYTTETFAVEDGKIRHQITAFETRNR